MSIQIVLQLDFLLLGEGLVCQGLGLPEKLGVWMFTNDKMLKVRRCLSDPAVYLPLQM